MPYRLIAPYASFLVCVFQISRSNIKYLIPAVFLTCILIHGYVTMPIFTIPFVLAALFVGIMRTNENVLIKENFNILIFSILTVAIFLLPILIDFYINSPNNIQKIINAKTLMNSMVKVEWRDIGNMVLDIVFKENPIGWLVSILTVPAIILSVNTTEAHNKKIIISLCHLLFVVFIVVLTYKNTPAPISTHVAQFIVTLPVLFFSIIFSTLFAEYKSNSKIFYGISINNKFYALTLIILTFILFSFPLKFSSLPDSGIEVSNFADQIEVSFPKRSVSINYTEHLQWSFIAGLILELEKRHIHACSTWRHMAFLYTERYVCDSNSLPDMEVVPLDSCKNQCLLQAGAYGLRLSILHKP